MSGVTQLEVDETGVDNRELDEVQSFKRNLEGLNFIFQVAKACEYKTIATAKTMIDLLTGKFDFGKLNGALLT